MTTNSRHLLGDATVALTLNGLCGIICVIDGLLETRRNASAAGFVDALR